MTSLRIARQIAAPPERVFALAANFASAADHISGIASIEMLTEGPVGIGTRFRETRVMFGREATEEMEVTTFEPPRRYVLEANSHGSQYVSELSFTANAEGTEVTMSFEATPLTFLAKVMSFLTKPLMKKMAGLCLKDLDDLKTAVEAG